MRFRVLPFRVLIGGVALAAAQLVLATCFLGLLDPPRECPNKDAPCIGLTVRSTGPFTVTFRGRTYSDSGGAKHFPYRVDRVPPGRSELTGSTSADTFSINIHAIGFLANGGALPASLESLEGPGASVRRTEVCRVSYAPAPGTPRPYRLRIQFDVGPGPPIC